MSRDLTESMLTQLEAGHVSPLFLADLEFASSTEHVWSGIGNIEWNGHTYRGLGHLASISAVTEKNEIQAQNITISLSGIPSELLEEAINEVKPNGTVKVWFGFMTNSGSIVADPSQVCLGSMDVPTINEGADTSMISITVENPLVDLQRANNRRYTHEDQKIDFPTDKGFEYVAAIQNWNGKWGKA